MPSSSDVILFFQNYYETWGYQLVFMGALLENILPIGYFVPGSTIVWLGAFYARDGELSFPLVIFFGILGAFLGHHVDYFMGRTGWYVVFKKFIPEKYFHKARNYFIREHFFEVFVVYFIGFTRSILIIAIGVLKIDYIKFVLFALVAAASWNVAFGLLGYFIGLNRQFLERGLNFFWFIGLVLLVSYFVTKLFKFRRREGRFPFDKS